MQSQEKLVRFDWAMKYMLRDKANFDILDGFLTALLKEDITVLEILESESNKSEDGLKYNRVDILVKDSKERQLIIEIQNNHEVNFLERILFGVSRAISENLVLGSSYSKVVKIISISILYFHFGTGDDYIYYGTTEFYGVHTKTPLKIREKKEEAGFTAMVKKENIFPEYYLIRVEDFENIINNPIDEWIYMIKNSEAKESFHSKNINKAREKLRVMQMPSGERKVYEKYLMNLASDIDVIQTAKEEGREEGRVEGREEGIVDTIRVIKLFYDDKSVSEIASITGLREEKIQKILEEWNGKV